MNERQCILAANISNKHGGEVEKTGREKVPGRNTRKFLKTLRWETVTTGGEKKNYNSQTQPKQQKALPLLPRRWSQEVTSVQQRPSSCSKCYGWKCTERERGSPQSRFQPQPWLTQFLARAVGTCHPATHRVKLRLPVECQACLWEAKLSVSWLAFTFTKAGQKWQRSLFICWGLRRWLMLCSSSRRTRAGSLPVYLQICRGRLSPPADGGLRRGCRGAPRHRGLPQCIGTVTPRLLGATQASELITNAILWPAKRRKTLNLLFQESGGVCTVHWHQLEKILRWLIRPNGNRNVTSSIYWNYPSKQRVAHAFGSHAWGEARTC